MVCRFIDGADYYNTADLTRKWTSEWVNGGTTTTVEQRTGARGIGMVGAFAHLTVTIDDQASWIIGLAWKGIGSFSGLPMLRIYDNGTIQCGLEIGLDGLLRVLGASATLVAGGKSTIPLHADRYAFIEWKVTIANSIAADSCIVRINEKEVINVDAGEDLQLSRPLRIPNSGDTLLNSFFGVLAFKSGDTILNYFF